jgi:phosphatidylinositol alpha-1,6-mannosyltransferase
MVAGEILDNPYWLREHPLNRLLNLVGKWMVHRASTVRVTTSTERKQLIAMGVPSNRVWNVPARVPFERLASPNSEPLRARFLQGGRDRLVLSVGRLAREKDYLTGLLTMRQVVSERPTTVWVVVGGGPEEHIIRHQVGALGLAENVFLTGPQPYELLADYYGAADCFFHCSTREGTAMVLLEAAFCALPIVSTDTTGARDAVKDGETGFIVPRGDYKTMAARLLQVLEHPSESRAMGERGKLFIQKAFDPEHLVRRYLDLWYFTAGRGVSDELKHEA